MDAAADGRGSCLVMWSDFDDRDGVLDLVLIGLVVLVAVGGAAVLIGMRGPS